MGNVIFNLRRTLLSMVIVFMTVLSIGCQGTASDSAKKSGKDGGYTLGVMINDTSNPFLATMGKAVQQEAEKLGMKVELVNGNKDMSTQLSAVNDLIAKRVDALILTASDPTAIVPGVKAGNRAKIPVFALNTAINTEKGGELVTYVGASDYDMGVAQAEMAAKALGGKGNVALVYGVLGTSPQVQRKRGVEETFAKKYPNLKIVDSCVDEWVTQKNLSCTQDLLSKYPQGKLNAILAQGPQLYVGAQYAHKNGRKDVLFFGADYHKQVAAGIVAGDIAGTIDQSPVAEGKLVAQAAYNWLKGAKDKVKRPNHFIDLPEITAANVKQKPAAWSG